MAIVQRPIKRGIRLLLTLLLCAQPNGGTAADLVGSNACRACHSTQFDAWFGSDHRNAMRPADASSVLGNFDDVSLRFHGIDSRLYREAGGFRIDTLGADGKPGTFDIAYTFGHYPLQQYLVDIGRGHLQALNIAWDSRDASRGGQRWYHLRSEEPIDPSNPFFWTRHLQNANSRCIECHATGVRKNYDAENTSYATAWTEPGVGCETCHGAASNHVALAESGNLSGAGSGFDRPLPARLAWTYRGDEPIATPEGKADTGLIDICGGCHSRRASLDDVRPRAPLHDQYRLALLEPGLYFDDGRIDDEVFVLGSFLQSRMHARGVTCGNCHDAHSGRLLAEGNALCGQCHQASVYDRVEHHRHPAETAGARCVACHMPERLYMQIDWRADHSFSIPDPELSATTGSPDACGACHQDRDSGWAAAQLRSWKSVLPPRRWALLNNRMARQDMLGFLDFARQPPGPDLAAIRQASLLSRLGAFPTRQAAEIAARALDHPDPLIRRAAAGALRSLPPDLRWHWLSPLLDDPVRSVRYEAVSALADILPRLDSSEAARLETRIDEYRTSLAFNADSPGGQLALGNLDAGLGFGVLAENAYLRALEIEADYIPALLNLADLYRSTGRDHESRELLRRALDVAPDSANTNHAYGLYLVRSGQTSAALPYLAAATEQEDSGPRHAYVYAVALDSSGRTADAIRLIEQQSERWPNHIDLAFLQVAYMDKTGQTDGIESYLSLLARVAAEAPQVRAWMKKYGGS